MKQEKDVRRLTTLEAVQEQCTRRLPDGWGWVRLGEICLEDRSVIGIDSSLPYLGLEDVESGTGRILNNRTGLEDEGVSNTFRLDERHVNHALWQTSSVLEQGLHPIVSGKMHNRRYSIVAS